jgi:tetratricopeptide (TPR) repeat protein
VTATSTSEGTGTNEPGRSKRAGRLDPDALAALEDQRDFLLRSLDDLEREREAGDVDEHDYETLKDDYTARAARTIRAIESHQARLAAAHKRRSWPRLLAVGAGIAAFAVLAGVLVAQASGRREAGEALTGEIRQTTRAQLIEAQGLAQQARYDEAIEVFDEILATQPDNAEALAYRGWTQYLSGDAAGAAETLRAAIEADPEYPDPFAFLAVILGRSGAPAEALDVLDRFESLDPPPDALDLVAGLRESLEREVAGAGPGTGSGDGSTATTGPLTPETSPTTTPPP